ncbi:MAG: ComF family protein [Prevotella sp.]|nr:ComF family protein [Prevotella sp.]
MQKKISFWHRMLNLIAPQACVVCGSRLAIDEEVVCVACNLHLPRTGFSANALDNEMARRFWGRIPIERAAALFFYEAGSEVSNIIYDLKYHNHPEIGSMMGRMAAEEFANDGFFEGIDLMIPIPLEKKRQRRRGYNQSMEIARGVNEVTGIPIMADIVERTAFDESQTHKSLAQRMESVENAFRAHESINLDGKHILIIDDIVTSGATICACVKALINCGDIKVSVMSLGMAK